MWTYKISAIRAESGTSRLELPPPHLSVFFIFTPTLASQRTPSPLPACEVAFPVISPPLRSPHPKSRTIGVGFGEMVAPYGSRDGCRVHLLIPYSSSLSVHCLPRPSYGEPRVRVEPAIAAPPLPSPYSADGQPTLPSSPTVAASQFTPWRRRRHTQRHTPSH